MSDQPDLAEDAKAQLKDLGDAAKRKLNTEAQSRAETARQAAADEVQSAADAANAAAAQFDTGSFQAQVAHQIADQIEAIATHLRQTNVSGLVAQTSDFARRNPLLFVGGAAALGFATTRFLKARDPRPDARDTQADPWQGTSGSWPDDLAPKSSPGAHLPESGGRAGHG